MIYRNYHATHFYAGTLLYYFNCSPMEWVHLKCQLIIDSLVNQRFVIFVIQYQLKTLFKANFRDIKSRYWCRVCNLSTDLFYYLSIIPYAIIIIYLDKSFIKILSIWLCKESPHWTFLFFVLWNAKDFSICFLNED